MDKPSKVAYLQGNVLSVTVALNRTGFSMSLADTDALFFPITRPNGDQHILVGTYYLADTDQPAPFALLLHGIPGSEKNHDLAQHLRADGWHVLVLHFSGTWGSGNAGESVIVISYQYISIAIR